MRHKTILIVLIGAMFLALAGIAQAQDAPKEITYMMWGSPEELAVWQTIVDEFQTANPGIKVNVDVSDWDSYWDKLRTLFAGGTPPDIFAMDAPLYPDWQSRGVLLNLQPYIDATPGFLDGFYPITLEGYQRDDGYYGLPRDFQTIALFYNKDMFDAAGMDYPTDQWTLDDLRAAAQKLTLDTNGDGVTDQWGFTADVYDMELFWSEALWENGADIISADHMHTLLGDDKARVAWHFIADMMLTDQSMPDPNETAQYGDDVFAAGAAAMTTIGHWVVPQYAALNFKWDVAPMPSGPEGRVTSVNSAGFVIAKDSQNPDATWEFVKYADGTVGQSRLAELGFAIPVLKSVAESPTYLEQASASINHKVFLDALEYAHIKPAFRGYDEWSSVVGDGLYSAWTGDTTIDDALDQIVIDADAVLANNQ
jgi:multiple sugar transport system substrate-binding protein